MTSGYASALSAYRAAGWPSVLPLPPGAKKPPPDGFTGHDGLIPNAATYERWAEEHRNGNIALRLPDGVIGIDVDEYGAKHGADTIERMEREHGVLPPAWVSSSRDWPSGIRWYRVPPGSTFVGSLPSVEIIQRHHRYAVVWPSKNPDADGAPYRWMTPDGEIVSFPPRLDDLPNLPTAWVEALRVPEPGTRGSANGSLPVRVERAPSVDRALVDALTHLYGGRHDATTIGVMALVRLRSQEYPGADDALAHLRSAFHAQVIGDGSRTERGAEAEWERMVAGAETKVSATPATAPRWEQREERINPRHLIREPAHHRDEARNEILDELTSWEPVNLRPILDGIAAGTTTRPTPTLALRADGIGLWYPARINGIFGDSGSGKSWAAMYACAQEVNAGRHVIWIDFEDQADSVTIRMLDLGLTAEEIDERFHYLSPDTKFGLVSGAPLLQLLDQDHPTLVVIDSTGEALAVQGVKDKDDEVAEWFRTFPRRISRTGTAVSVLDHVVKDPENRGLYAIGTQRKRAAIDGAVYLMEATRQFGIGQTGAAKLTTAKDRNGTHVKGRLAATFHLDATRPDDYRVGLEAPNVGSSDEPFRPTTLMEKVSRHLELTPEGLSKNTLEKEIVGKVEYVRKALGYLVSEGYVTVARDGQALIHTIAKSYREGDDPLDEHGEPRAT